MFDRYVELGDFLRTRRAQADPARAGLPTATRRRSEGLRREDVAMLAHLSPTWYTRLERGHRVQPSPEVLTGVADALRLNGVERRYLRALAEDLPPGAGAEASPDLVDAVRGVVGAHDGCALPVFAVQGRSRLLAWNPATVQWYGEDFARSGRDVLAWLFTVREARWRLAEWASSARGTVAGLRFEMGVCHTGPDEDPSVRALYDGDPDFARWWALHDVADNEIRYRAFCRPDGRVHRLRLLAVHPVATPTVTVVHHLWPDGTAVGEGPAVR